MESRKVAYTNLFTGQEKRCRSREVTCGHRMRGGWLGQIGKVALSYIHSVQCCGSAGKESACNAGDLGSISGLGNPLEKGKATHSSILAWRIPQTVQSMGLQRVGHD